jgi:radical SAM protein with 4Fe4S-binding SPASM domain
MSSSLVRSPIRSRKLSKLGYQWRVYGGFHAANRAYSPEEDMARHAFPRTLQLQTINACQAACTMCPYPVVKDRFPRGRMDDALFDKVVAEVAEHRDQMQIFAPLLQNEPFLDKHLFARIKRVKAATAGKVEVELVTNGAFLSDENIALMREAELDVLDISLDAVSREVYQKVRVGLDFDAVMAGVERVLAADLPHTAVFVRLVRLRENFDEIEGFARTWRKRGVPVFVYTANNRTGALDDWQDNLAIPEARLSLFHKAQRRLARLLLGHCPVPFSTANILHDGQMLMCVHDWQRKEVLGNVRDHTIAALWNGPRMREIRRLVSERRYDEVAACRDCSLWRDGWF